MRLATLVFAWLVCSSSLLGFAVAAEGPPATQPASRAVVNGPVNVDADGVALQRHDPVAFFTDNRPTLGVAEFTATHQGAVYWFASDANRQLFVKSPEQYLPRFGGYCAFGVSKGYKAPVDVAAFEIWEGRLIFNYNKSVQAGWQKDRATRLPLAEVAWKKLSAEGAK